MTQNIHTNTSTTVTNETNMVLNDTDEWEVVEAAPTPTSTLPGVAANESAAHEELARDDGKEGEDVVETTGLHDSSNHHGRRHDDDVCEENGASKSQESVVFLPMDTSPASEQQHEGVNGENTHAVSGVLTSQSSDTTNRDAEAGATMEAEPHSLPASANSTHTTTDDAAEMTSTNILDSIGTSVRNLGDTLSTETKKLGVAIGMESEKRIDRRLQKFGKDIGMESDKRIDRRIKRAVQDGFASVGGSTSTGTASATTRQSSSHNNNTKALTDLAAAAAVVSGGILLAKGNHGVAGATLLATGATTYVASEVLRESYARRHDNGLNEDLALRMHMD